MIQVSLDFDFISFGYFSFHWGMLFSENPLERTRGDPLWPSGYDGWLSSFSLLVQVSAGSSSGLAWPLYKCAAL